MRRFLSLFVLLLLASIVEAEEVHPKLLFSQSDIPALREKLGSSDIGGRYVGKAIVGTLKGNRSEEAITFLSDTISKNNQALAGKGIGHGQELMEAYLVYDIQQPFMTESEKTNFRTDLLSFAEAHYDGFIAQNSWWHQPREMNNWSFTFRNDPLITLFFAGHLFPDDPRSANFLSKGREVFNQLFFNSPNNGVYNRTTQSWDVVPTKVDGWDEVFGAPGAYGIWASIAFNSFFHVLDRHEPNLDFETVLGGMLESQSRYYVYNLNHYEDSDFSGNGAASYTGIGGSHGGSHKGILEYNSVGFLTYVGYRLNQPVISWLPIANPSWTRGSPLGFLQEWQSGTRANYSDFFEFLAWGEFELQSPAEANWPLTEFWENAGIGVIRKSWTKNQRVITDLGMADEPTGFIWLHAGPMGSKFRNTVGGVYYQADEAEILTSGPFICTCSAPGAYWLLGASETQNGIIVDGVAPTLPPRLSVVRDTYGETTRLGEDTFIMDMSPTGKSNYRGYFEYPGSPITEDLNWKRKVHYDREKDILWIKDVASLSDGEVHDFRFNWNSPEFTIRSGQKLVELPAGYKMVYRSNLGITKADSVEHTGAFDLSGDESHKFSTFQIGGDARQIKMLWAVAKDSDMAATYLEKNRGAFISGVGSSVEGAALKVSFSTDESARVKVEYGETSALGSVVSESSAAQGNRELTVPLPQGTRIFYRLVATDSHGDDTIADNNGEMFTSDNAGPKRPMNLRVDK